MLARAGSPVIAGVRDRVTPGSAVRSFTYSTGPALDRGRRLISLQDGRERQRTGARRSGTSTSWVCPAGNTVVTLDREARPSVEVVAESRVLRRRPDRLARAAPHRSTSSRTRCCLLHPGASRRTTAVCGLNNGVAAEVDDRTDAEVAVSGHEEVGSREVLAVHVQDRYVPHHRSRRRPGGVRPAVDEGQPVLVPASGVALDEPGRLGADTPPTSRRPTACCRSSTRGR